LRKAKEPQSRKAGKPGSRVAGDPQMPQVGLMKIFAWPGQLLVKIINILGQKGYLLLNRWA
jgi:hypothetical protein